MLRVATHHSIEVDNEVCVYKKIKNITQLSPVSMFECNSVTLIPPTSSFSVVVALTGTTPTTADWFW